MAPPFRWLLPRILAGGPHPDRSGGVPALVWQLRTEGIGAILSVYESPLDRAALERFKMRYAWQPTPDFAAPPELGAACAFIDEARRASTATLVHCWAGWGRTGTVLAAYLLHTRACPSAERAIEQVRRDYEPYAVESSEQLEALRIFARAALGFTNS